MQDVIEINGEKYKKISSLKEDNEELRYLRYVIARTYTAGVFAGYVEEKNDKRIVLRNARRLWFWDGAASLSQLAMEGVSKPKNCKFPVEVNRVELTECIEILDVTEEAKKSIASVEIWKA